jgi:hypothetical protein
MWMYKWTNDTVWREVFDIAAMLWIWDTTPHCELKIVREGFNLEDFLSDKGEILQVRWR